MDRRSGSPVRRVLAVLGGAVFPLFAATYSIAPQGSDQAAGTVATPWKTLEYAYGRMAAGDTVLVRTGIYAGVAMTWNKSGAAGRPLVVKAYGSERPVFQGNGEDIFIQSFGRHLVFDGLEITGYTRCAFNPKGGGKMTIRNCRMRRIQAQDYGAVTPQYCDSIVIEDNIFQESGRSLEQIQFDHAIYNAAGSHDILIRNNLFLDNYGGPAINHYHTPSPYNVRIYNNVFVMTAGAERSGIFVGDGAHHVGVYNNTFYLEGKGATRAYGLSFNSGQGTNEAYNNLFFFKDWKMEDAISPHAAFQDKSDHNLYFPSKDPEDRGAHSLAGDPLFVNAVGRDLRPGPSSPALDAGLSRGAADGAGVPGGGRCGQGLPAPGSEGTERGTLSGRRPAFRYRRPPSPYGIGRYLIHFCRPLFRRRRDSIARSTRMARSFLPASLILSALLAGCFPTGSDKPENTKTVWLMDQTISLSEGDTVCITRHLYDKDNRESLDTVIAGHPEFWGYVRWEYDANGRVSRWTTVDTGRTSYIEVGYTDFGKQSINRFLDADGGESRRTTFEYDAIHRRVREVEYSRGDTGLEVVSVLHHYYGADTLMDSSQSVSSSGEINFRSIYTYAGGLLTRIRSESEGSDASVTVMVYRTDGKLSEMRYEDGMGLVTGGRLYEYDSHGNLVKDSIYSGDRGNIVHAFLNTWKKAPSD